MSFPPGTEMFQFPGFAFDPYEFRIKYFLLKRGIRNQASGVRKKRPDSCFLTPESSLRKWVAPFGNPRIKASSQLLAAYRSVVRPSSPLSAKASTKCP